jgi:hypothetical protein|tara:strand:- start:4961 stop:5137 length:177 start_codon:yes stop_codon:yes gene_type:complete
MRQGELLSYWVVKTYDPVNCEFVDSFKSYGRNTANNKLVGYLKKGICAVIELRTMPPA